MSWVDIYNFLRGKVTFSCNERNGSIYFTIPQGQQMELKIIVGPLNTIYYMDSPAGKRPFENLEEVGEYLNDPENFKLY